MTVIQALLESWRRQAQIIDNIASLMDDRLLDYRLGEDEWILAHHLAHINHTRRYWLNTVTGEENPSIVSLYTKVGEDYVPSRDLNEIRAALKASAAALEKFFAESLEDPERPIKQYEHPVFFIQHMIWHEGYHYGVLNLALRLAGSEPSEEWEEKHVWELWRGVEVWEG